MDPNKTNDWIDLYSLVLDSLAEFLADPQKRALKMGITLSELNAQEAKLPKKIDMEEYRILCTSWRNVARDLKALGVRLDEDIQLAPTMAEMKGPWNANPWLEVFHEGEKPIKFFGRDALTAIGFFSFFINQCDVLDPTIKIKRNLEAQGITKENFDERMALTGIANPWREGPLPSGPVPVILPPTSP